MGDCPPRRFVPIFTGGADKDPPASRREVPVGSKTLRTTCYHVNARQRPSAPHPRWPHHCEWRQTTREECGMDDATRNGQTPTAAETVELDTAPRPVVATIPQASRAARKSSQPLRIVATGGNLLSSALLDLTLARRAERRERLR